MLDNTLVSLKEVLDHLFVNLSKWKIINFLFRNEIMNSHKHLGSVALVGPDLPKVAQYCLKWPSLGNLTQSGPVLLKRA